MQQKLFTTEPAFDGETFDQDLDGARLARQLTKVLEYMLAREWCSLAEIHADTRVPEASASARLRDLRKEKFGGYTVLRRRRSPGTFEYQVRP